MIKHNIINDFITKVSEKSIQNNEIGLWNGQMGQAILLYSYSKYSGDTQYSEIAEKIIDNVIDNINRNTPLTYATGLTGIGVGIEYLIQEKFIEGVGDEILEDIDGFIRSTIYSKSLNPLINLENGLCGIGYYLYYRLKNKSELDDDIRTLRCKESLILWVGWVDSLMEQGSEQDICDVYFLLIRIRKLNIINFKIDRLLSFCLTRFSTLCLSPVQIINRYEYLGIPSFKILSSWISATI